MKTDKTEFIGWVPLHEKAEETLEWIIDPSEIMTATEAEARQHWPENGGKQVKITITVEEMIVPEVSAPVSQPAEQLPVEPSPPATDQLARQGRPQYQPRRKVYRPQQQKPKLPAVAAPAAPQPGDSDNK